MKLDKKVTRQDFLKTGLAAAGVVVGIGGVGCGGDDDGGGGGGGNNGCSSDISPSHGHALTITAADISAAADKTYDIQGTSAHTHSVTVSANQFGNLDGGGQITLTSTAGGPDAHTHSIIVNC